MALNQSKGQVRGEFKVVEIAIKLFLNKLLNKRRNPRGWDLSWTFSFELKRSAFVRPTATGSTRLGLTRTWTTSMTVSVTDFSFCRWEETSSYSRDIPRSRQIMDLIQPGIVDWNCVVEEHQMAKGVQRKYEVKIWRR